MSSAEAEREKRALRARLAAERRAIAPAVRRPVAAAICAHLRAAPAVAAAERFAAYVALADEVPLDEAIDAAIAQGRLLLPRVAGDSLDFVPVESLASLRAGSFGVDEPEAGRVAAVLGARDVVLLPGVAFDRRGGRLGRGRGFYDRALRGSAAIAIGVAFEMQVVEAVPMLPHDRRVDALVTERGLRWCTARDPAGDPG